MAGLAVRDIGVELDAFHCLNPIFIWLKRAHNGFILGVLREID